MTSARPEYSFQIVEYEDGTFVVDVLRRRWLWETRARLHVGYYLSNGKRTCVSFGRPYCMEYTIKRYTNRFGSREEALDAIEYAKLCIEKGRKEKAVRKKEIVASA